MRFGDGVLFAERANESEHSACLSPYGTKAQRKQVLTAHILLFVQDPKPGELAMGRVNLGEIREEARTREPFNTLGRPVARSEKLIELGNSWFSPK